MNDNQLKCSIKLTNVSFAYNNLSIIQNVSLNVNSGQVVALVGPSGCGKTTLLNIIAGHLSPSSGEVKTHGAIRTISQQDGLFPWLTVHENILMGFRGGSSQTILKNDVLELLNVFQLDEFQELYPHQISGGMRQRVELARALAGNSEILLMDEPFSSLDYLARLQMRSELIKFLKKWPRSTVLVTHDIEEAIQLADKVIILAGRPMMIYNEHLIDISLPRATSDLRVIKLKTVILRELGFEEEPNGVESSKHHIGYYMIQNTATYKYDK